MLAQVPAHGSFRADAFSLFHRPITVNARCSFLTRASAWGALRVRLLATGLSRFQRVFSHHVSIETWAPASSAWHDRLRRTILFVRLSGTTCSPNRTCFRSPGLLANLSKICRRVRRRFLARRPQVMSSSMKCRTACAVGDRADSSQEPKRTFSIFSLGLDLQRSGQRAHRARRTSLTIRFPKFHGYTSLKHFGM